MKSEGRENNMKAEGRDNNMRDNNMKAEGARTRAAPMRPRTKGTSERSQTTTGQAGAGAKLTTDQRTKITTVIKSQQVESVNNVNFSVSVGTRVPREGVHFYPLPAEVVTIYPEWRGYEFILVHDQDRDRRSAARYEIVADHRRLSLTTHARNPGRASGPPLFLGR